MDRFIESVPPLVRLLLAMAICIGVTLTMARVFRSSILALNAQDEIDKDERKRRAEQTDEIQPPLPPETYNLSARILGLLTTAFVFLLAFTLGNFWGDTKDAASAVQAEAGDWIRATTLAGQLPESPEREALRQALADYRENLLDVQWPLMQKGNSMAAYSAQIDVATGVANALLRAQAAGADKAPEWGALSSSVQDMTEQASDRVDAIPNRAAPSVVGLIFILGVSNLAMTTIFQPSRYGTNMFLLGVMAGITALLLFVVVEASNPYLGAISVTLPNLSGG